MKTKLKKPAAKTAAEPKNRRRQILILIGLVVVLCGLVAAAISYRNHQENQRQEQAFAADKAQFAIVEAEMAKAYEAIVAAAGKPDKDIVSNSCSRVGFKFDKGELSCGPGYSVVYELSSYPESQDLTMKVQQAIVSTGKFTIEPNSRTAKSIDVSDTRMSGLNIDFKEQSGVSCQLKFEYMSPKYRIGFSDLKDDNAAFYGFRCAKSMERPIYPLAK